jgi:hypothetical protein
MFYKNISLKEGVKCSPKREGKKWGIDYVFMACGIIRGVVYEMGSGHMKEDIMKDENMDSVMNQIACKDFPHTKITEVFSDDCALFAPIPDRSREDD